MIDVLIARAKAHGVINVYELGSVPATPPNIYAVISHDTGRAVNRRAGGPGRDVRRIVVQMFGRTLRSVLMLAEQVDAAFNDVVIAELPDRPASRREVGASPYRDPDVGGVIVALHTYTLS